MPADDRSDRRVGRTVVRATAGLAAAGAATAFYGGVIERNLFTLRRFTVPVLDPGTPAVRILHLSDLHLTRDQHRKQAWIGRLARLAPDYVINTGDTSSDPLAVESILHTLAPLFRFPGAFVPGNNDYYIPQPKNPARYFMRNKVGSLKKKRPMPWPELASGMAAAGWQDLTHVRTTVDIGGVPIALAGTDDPHLKKARYGLIAGAADARAAVRIGVTHSPEPAILSSFAGDGYDLVLAGHTHGGQIRIPFGPAIVTNCGIDVHRARWLHQWDEHMWFNVCAGLGTNPFLPFRIGCRPEAVLLTLLPRDTGSPRASTALG